jgi:tetratricopeptide (TPR) repeat protein
MPSLITLALLGALLVQDPGPAAAIELVDLAGAARPLAVADRTTVAIFLRPKQEWSELAIRDLEELSEHYREQKVRFVAVWAVEDPVDRWKSFELPWLELLDRERVASRSQHVVAYPTTAIIGTDGATAFRLPSRPPEYRGQIEEALRAALGLTEIPEAPEPAPAQPWHRHLHLAERLFARGEIDAAAAALARAEKEGGGRIELLPLRTELALEHGELEAARPWVAELIAHAPEDPKILFLAGRFARRDGRAAEAEGTLRPLLATSPHDLDLVLELGQALEALGRAAEAAELYRHAIEKVRAREERDRGG